MEHHNHAQVQQSNARPFAMENVYAAALNRHFRRFSWAPSLSRRIERNAASVYRERRRRVLDAMGPKALAILQGAKLKVRSRDTHYPFRQDSDFHYLTGFDQPNAVAVLRNDGGPPFVLYVEPRAKEQETWTGLRPGTEGAIRDYGADEAFPIDGFEDALPSLLRGVERVYHVLGQAESIDRALLGALERSRLHSRSHEAPPETLIDPRGILHEMRLIKEPGEVEIMRRAAAISAQAHREAAKRARSDTPEYVLESILDYVFRRNGASGPAYETIVGSGANATILHYVANNHILRKAQLVLIDAGCELDGYASDVTRTYPVDGSFTPANRQVYEIVRAAQQAALAACAPSTTLPVIHQAALRQIVQGLVDLGVLEGSVEGLIEKEAYKPYYMHQTSHWLGLDVHDVGTYSRNEKPRLLEPGMVFTVEPGLYFATDDESVPVAFRGIGVRIEDNVLITSDGMENLTAAIPTHASEIETWVRGA